MVTWKERQPLNGGSRHWAVYRVTHGQIIGVFCLSFAWSGKGATGAMSPDWRGGGQLMASWAGGKKPRLHLSDFNE